MGAPLSLYHVRAKISEGNYRSAIFPSLLSPRNRIFAANFSFGRASIDLIKYFARAEVIALRFIVSSNPNCSLPCLDRNCMDIRIESAFPTIRSSPSFK